RRSSDLLGRGIGAVGQETISLQQRCRAEELVRVPPERRAGSGAACTENTRVQAIQLLALLRRLQALDSGRRRVVLQIRLNLLILPIDAAHNYDTCTEYRQNRPPPQGQPV